MTILLTRTKRTLKTLIMENKIEEEIFKLKKEVSSTLKSSQTEDWIDYHIVRPQGYMWARLFARIGMHPNTVTIIFLVFTCIH